MATHQISMMGWPITPDATGNTFPQRLSADATNGLFKHLVLAFADTATQIGFDGAFPIPQNYVGSSAVIPIWSATSTTGNVVWEIGYRPIGGDDTESLDQATYIRTASVTDAAPTASFNRLTPTISPTSADFAAGKTVQYFFSRNQVSGVDTMVGRAYLADLIFSYSDA